MIRRERTFWLLVLAGAVFLITRLAFLTSLPVFADEAIYIRWAQMISNDPQEHLFLPMYDGKTPLYMWILSQILWISRSNPVWMGRFVSVLAGLVTCGVLVLTVKRLGGDRVAQIATYLMYLMMPFTYFHDRMALTDGMLTMFLAITLLLLVRLKEEHSVILMLVLGIGFGLSMLSKLPGLLFLVQFLLVLWLMPPRLSAKKQRRAAVLFGGAAIVGVGILYSLRMSELFPFLFTRSGDFTFSVKDLLGLTNGGWSWRFLTANVVRFVRWQVWYSTLGIIVITLLPFTRKQWRKNKKVRMLLALQVMMLTSAGFFLIFGKVIYSRYFLPTVIFIIPAASLATEFLWEKRFKVVLGVVGGMVVLQSAWFIYPFTSNIYHAHLENEDQHQYLTEWSAGFGNKEVADYLKKMAVDQYVLVAAEGYFGTLPDGLSIYFDGSKLNNRVTIYGVGQPVTSLSQVIGHEETESQRYLVVNENRLQMNLEGCCEVIERYHRPYNGADLLLVKINQKAKSRSYDYLEDDT